MSLKVLIFEDESLSAEHLVNLINRYDPSVELLGIIESVKKGVEWFSNNQHPDLMLMDIQLSDGSCFDLFKQVSLEIPVIFTTAYNEYAIQAFKVNSIDYLLKPIEFQDLKLAFEKFGKRQRIYLPNSKLLYEQIYTQLLHIFARKTGYHGGRTGAAARREPSQEEGASWTGSILSSPGWTAGTTPGARRRRAV